MTLRLWRGTTGRLTWAAMFLVGGCAHVNHRLNDAHLPIENRVTNQTRASLNAAIIPMERKGLTRIHPASRPARDVDRLASVRSGRDGSAWFVGLAISGGGSRSANFAAACMFQLQRLGILQKVNYISSVSGGSLPAAYYCVHDQRWNPSDAQVALSHPFAGDVIVKIFLPWNLFGLGFTDLSRSDLLADSFCETLFRIDGKNLTFADLRADRPHLLINATDLQSGRRFVFCNESFDDLNSDLARYPLADAVAASSAVPVVLHSVVLRDFSTVFGQYHHLIDGGIVDNLGVQSLVEVYQAQSRQATDQGTSPPYPAGAILIVIDAKTPFDGNVSDKGSIGVIDSLKAAIGLSSTVLLNRASNATLSELIVHNSPDEISAGQLRAQIAQLESTGYVQLKDIQGRPVHVVHLSLSRIGDISNLPSQSFSKNVNSIQTYYNIEPAEAFNLYKAAELIVREKFQTRLADLAKLINAPTPQPAK